MSFPARAWLLGARLDVREPERPEALALAPPESRTVGRVEVAEKPEITWDDTTLDRFYERLAAEYELRDRDRALQRKLEIVASTAETYLDLLHTRQNLRVEWYIVVLIVVEIVILLYDMFLR